MRLAGLEVDARVVASCDFSYASGFRTAGRLIAEHAPTAVVGFDDRPQATQTFPGLTAVRQPLHDMGQKAARALLSLVEVPLLPLPGAVVTGWLPVQALGGVLRNRWREVVMLVTNVLRVGSSRWSRDR
ncbi:substrate-binding domain-containing protein [Streptomyces sp. NPDC007851]|uniref:substrate-binding domain-containing protein n=1 Tax=Streptomyces sp. NPDC007851 TaxID=3155008 RepID=UPI0033D51A10